MYQVVAYYLIINHIFAVVHRFGCDGLLDESLCLELIVRKLKLSSKGLSERGQRLVRYLLESEVLKCKSNLLTQLRGIDELDCSDSTAVYVLLDNPLNLNLISKSSVKTSQVKC